MCQTETNSAKTIASEQLPQLNAEQAKAIDAVGEVAVVFAMIELAKQLAEAHSQRFPASAKTRGFRKV